VRHAGASLTVSCSLRALGIVVAVQRGMQKISVVQSDGGEVGVLNESSSAELNLRLDDGRRVAVSRDDLEPLADGTVLLKTPLDHLTELDPASVAPVVQTMTVPVTDPEAQARFGGAAEQPPTAIESDGQTVLIPRVEEQLQVHKTQQVRGTVRVHVVPTEHEQKVSVPVTNVRAEVKRVAVGRIVDAAPPVREEGNTVIVSIVEEVLVVEKRLLLREEIHIERQHTTKLEEHQVKLRSERVEVTRSDE
jgi:stress response protein YsnF